jgi:hypothetical protein
LKSLALYTLPYVPSPTHSNLSYVSPGGNFRTAGLAAGTAGVITGDGAASGGVGGGNGGVGGRAACGGGTVGGVRGRLEWPLCAPVLFVPFLSAAADKWSWLGVTRWDFTGDRDFLGPLGGLQ